MTNPLDDDAFQFPTLQTARTELRLLTLADAAIVHRHFADEDVTRFMDIDVCQSLDEAREIIRFHIDDSGCRWGILDKADDRLLGTCGYHSWNKPAKQAEVGYDLGKAYWGQGLMAEVLEVVLPFGFRQMGLARITADVERDNARSINLLKRLCFQLESSQDPLLAFQLDGQAHDAGLLKRRP